VDSINQPDLFHDIYQFTDQGDKMNALNAKNFVD
jgi:hypothetical protein